MLNKIAILLSSLLILSACASNQADVDVAKRIGECIIDGNQNGNCEMPTLEGK